MILFISLPVLQTKIVTTLNEFVDKLREISDVLILGRFKTV
jgi:hypothetical protein